MYDFTDLANMLLCFVRHFHDNNTATFKDKEGAGEEYSEESEFSEISESDDDEIGD